MCINGGAGRNLQSSLRRPEPSHATVPSDREGNPSPEKSVNDNRYTGLWPETITLLQSRERSVSAGEHTCLLRSFQT